MQKLEKERIFLTTDAKLGKKQLSVEKQHSPHQRSEAAALYAVWSLEERSGYGTLSWKGSKISLSLNMWSCKMTVFLSLTY